MATQFGESRALKQPARERELQLDEQRKFKFYYPSGNLTMKDVIRNARFYHRMNPSFAVYTIYNRWKVDRKRLAVEFESRRLQSMGKLQHMLMDNLMNGNLRQRKETKVLQTLKGKPAARKRSSNDNPSRKSKPSPSRNFNESHIAHRESDSLSRNVGLPVELRQRNSEQPLTPKRYSDNAIHVNQAPEFQFNARRYELSPLEHAQNEAHLGGRRPTAVAVQEIRNSSLLQFRDSLDQIEAQQGSANVTLLRLQSALDPNPKPALQLPENQIIEESQPVDLIHLSSSEQDPAPEGKYRLDSESHSPHFGYQPPHQE